MLPIWSAAVDPRVIAVRALVPAHGHARLFDGQSADVRPVRGPHYEHLAIDRESGVIRLDVIDGTVTAGPVTLHFELPDDDRFEMQISTLRAFREPTPAARPQFRAARRLLALQAVDARDAGASLREIASYLFGPGAWPGNGEHRKSLVRRMLVDGDRMIRTGPTGVLGDRRDH